MVDNTKENESFDSFSGDGWDDYDDEVDYDETPKNNNQENINEQKEEEIEIINPNYQKNYFKSFGNGYNKKYKGYHEYNSKKPYNHRSYKENNNNSFYERNYRDNINNSYYDKNYRDNHNNSYYEKGFKDNKNSYYERSHYNRNKNFYNNRENRDNNNLVNKSYRKGNYNYKKEHKDYKEHLKIHVFEEENIKKPIFYNSKKPSNKEEKKENLELKENEKDEDNEKNIKNKENEYEKEKQNVIKEEKEIDINKDENNKNYLLLENILQLDKINDQILAKKNEQIQIVKDKISKNLEKEYGTLNINANVYIPKRKVMMISQNKPNFNLMNQQGPI